MARWELAIELDRHQGVPLYRQIARAITDDIRRGRLRAGDPLPGSRTLARTLGVQRLTVVTAFDELIAEGWIVANPARGTVVSPALLDSPPVNVDRR
ncbi:MAG TPA: winged helix-turn-helix domain-containing protein, partial [Thermoanaerobaculia bacterium]